MISTSYGGYTIKGDNVCKGEKVKTTLEETIEKKGKDAIFESVFDTEKIMKTRSWCFYSFYDNFESFYKEIDFTCLNDNIGYISKCDFLDMPLNDIKKMFKEQLRKFYNDERMNYLRTLEKKAYYFDKCKDLIYNSLSNDEKRFLKTNLPNETFNELPKNETTKKSKGK